MHPLIECLEPNVLNARNDINLWITGCTALLTAVNGISKSSKCLFPRLLCCGESTNVVHEFGIDLLISQKLGLCWWCAMVRSAFLFFCCGRGCVPRDHAGEAIDDTIVERIYIFPKENHISFLRLSQPSHHWLLIRCFHRSLQIP